MALEAFISFAIGKIGDILIEEIKFLSDVEEEVQSLQEKLTWLQSYMRDTDARLAQGDELFQNSVRQIRRIAFDAEDVIESFIEEAASRKKESHLKRYVCVWNCLKHTHQVGTEVDKINQRIKETITMLERFGVRRATELPPLSSNTKGPPRVLKSYAHVEDDDVVGLDKDIRILVERLLDKHSKSFVLSIVGIGGLGKTTLARQVYNQSEIKHHFEHKAWVSISLEWQKRDVLLEILKQTRGIRDEERKSVNCWSERELLENLYNFLKQKLYLVVLDDTWKVEAWDDMFPALPRGNGSKILITTRNKDLPSHADPYCFVHEPKMLNETQAWKLFSTKLGLDWASTISDLKNLGGEMVKKCDGLPLAIIALAGILQMKNEFEEWETINKAFASNIRKSRGSQQYGKVETMLELSYYDLPYDLKMCFLYLGIFPEDFEIPTGMLMRMWIAEGFITSKQLSGGEIREDVAARCLEQLLQRCMIQVARRNCAGKVKKIRIHDLMRDICIQKAKEHDFLEILSLGRSRAVDLPTFGSEATALQSRRAAIYSRMCFPLAVQNSHLRSLLQFGQAIPNERAPASDGSEDGSKDLARGGLGYVCDNFKRLGVLNLVGVQTSSGDLPQEIGDLIFLSYLGMQDTTIWKLPRSIGNLRNLSTLVVKDVVAQWRADITWAFDGELTLPNVIWKLARLRNLILPSRELGHVSVCCENSGEQLELHTLENLQTLWGVTGESWKIEGLAKLHNLRKLMVKQTQSKEQLEAILECPSIKFDRVHRLHLEWGELPLRCRARGWRIMPLVEDFELPSLEPISHCNHLSRLALEGRLGEMLSHQVPQNLTELCLSYSNLSQDPMMVLGSLKRLKKLILNQNAYNGTKMACNANAFLQLEHLELSYLEGLVNWKVEKGTMPRLTYISIQSCDGLKALPEGLSHINTIKKLEVSEMPLEFCWRLRPKLGDGLGGEDLYITERIPSVQIHSATRSDGEWMSVFDFSIHEKERRAALQGNSVEEKGEGSTQKSGIED